MFKKSLVLLCMVFGLHAWANPPATISRDQLIQMIRNHNVIEENHDTWELEESKNLLGEPVDEHKELIPFLKKLPATHKAALSHRSKSKAEYTINADGTIYSLILKKK